MTSRSKSNEVQSTGSMPHSPHAWGKLTWSTQGTPTSLSLIAHCTDVAAVTVTLLGLSVWRRRFECIAGRTLTNVDIARLGVLAFLHDVGKTSVGFWLKQLDEPRPDGSRCTDARFKALRALRGDFRECGHTREVIVLMTQSMLRQAAEVLPVVEIGRWCEGKKLLWWAAISHHGNPIVPEGNLVRSDWMWRPAPSLGYDPMVELTELTKHVRAVFPEAFIDAPVLPSNRAFIHAFAGLVSLADWIASNPAPGFFPYDLAADEGRWECALERAAQVMLAMQLDATDARKSLYELPVGFGDVFFNESTGRPFEPTRLQQAMDRMDLGPLLIAEDETGAGKTEAALWRFKVLYEQGEVDALAFVLPTRVSAVAIQERVQRFIDRLFPDGDRRPNVVLAVPGYIKSDGQDGKRGEPGTLAHWDVLWDDSPSDASAHRRWAAEHPKRYLAAAVAVGTVDQVLLSGLQTAHSHLRAVSLLRTLIVVDEVHSSDTYMTRILEAVLSRHILAGGHALLLSATLGGELRQKFLHPPRPGDVFEPPEFDELLSAPYPLLSGSRDSIDLSQPSFEGSVTIKRKVVNLSPAPIMRNAQAIAAYAAEYAERGAKVLVVRNTVNGAIDVHAALVARLGEDHPALFRLNGVSCPHHGRFAVEDRKRLDAEVNRQFGKGSSVEARVLVGTQTLEQSLDLCADYLITDLCPIDVLLQRIGRLHRHQRLRPPGFEAAHVLVLCPPERDLTSFLSRGGPSRHGLGRVYPNLLSVDATWEMLSQQSIWSIPQDNRRLVESCTNSLYLYERAARLGEKWTTHWREWVGDDSAKRGAATVRRLDWRADPFAPFADNLDARTRLGDARRLLKLPLGALSPFPDTQGQAVCLSQLQIPHFLWPESCNAEEVEHIEVEDQGFRFSVENHNYRYDCNGLILTNVRNF